MITIPTLTTDRLILRPLGPQDADTIAEFYLSERSRFVGGPASPELSWRMLAGELGHWALRGYGRWAVEDRATSALVGIVGLWNPVGWPEPEIGWDLMNGFEGRGYATEAARASRDYAYDTLGWPTAISLVADDNHGSAAVALRLGAVEEGRFTHERYGSMRLFRHPAPGAVG